jgi:hypothetical protein
MGNQWHQLAQAVEETDSRVGKQCGDGAELGEVAAEPDHGRRRPAMGRPSAVEEAEGAELMGAPWWLAV